MTAGAPSETTLLLRDLRTLDVIAEITGYRDVTWTRRDISAGEFGLTVHQDSIADLDLPGLDISAPGWLVEVRRGSAHEFAGVIEHGSLDSVSGTWTLGGPDLLGFFLEGRTAGRYGEDAQSNVPAETALKHYVAENAGSDADPDRQWSTYLDGITWAVEADGARGATVDFTALRRNLLADVLVPIARSGDLLQEVAIVEGTGYEYRVSEPQISPAPPFSVSWANVAEMEYRFDRRGVRNAILMLGPGTGDTRDETEVIEPGSVARDGLREAFEDARDAATSDDRQTLGLAAIAARDYARVSASAQPSRSAVYRQDYDVGWDVALSVPEASVAEVIRRIVAVRVELNQAGERITVEMGAPPQTLGGLTSDALLRSQRASYG